MEAKCAGQKDGRIALYERLTELAPSPVVELNRAVAIAMAEGPAAGLAIVESLAQAQSLPGYHLLPAVHADLLRRLHRLDEAAGYYREALSLATSDRERHFLERRLREATKVPKSLTQARPRPGMVTLGPDERVNG